MLWEIFTERKIIDKGGWDHFWKMNDSISDSTVCQYSQLMRLNRSLQVSMSSHKATYITSHERRKAIERQRRVSPRILHVKHVSHEKNK